MCHVSICWVMPPMVVSSVSQCLPFPFTGPARHWLRPLDLHHDRAGPSTNDDTKFVLYEIRFSVWAYSKIQVKWLRTQFRSREVTFDGATYSKIQAGSHVPSSGYTRLDLVFKHIQRSRLVTVYPLSGTWGWVQFTSILGNSHEVAAYSVQVTLD